MQLRQKKFLMRCIDTESEVSVVFIYGSFDKLGLENNRVFYLSPHHGKMWDDQK